MKTLLIINPQNDFYIEGSPRYNMDNEYVVDKIVELIENNKEINEIILAITSHPNNSVMFGQMDNGCEKYCVTDTNGVNVISRISTIFKRKNKSRKITCKTYQCSVLNTDNTYSVCPYVETIDNKIVLKSSTEFASINNTDLIICGFDGDKEIIATLNDLAQIRNKDLINISLYLAGISSTNDNILTTYIEDKNIKTYVPNF